MTDLRDETRAARATLVLRGEIDLANAEHIRDVAAAAVLAGVSQLVVDLRDVSFMDSEGLKAMLLARQDLREAGATLRLRRPPPCVRQLLSIAGVEGLFDVV